MVEAKGRVDVWNILGSLSEKSKKTKTLQISLFVIEQRTYLGSMTGNIERTDEILLLLQRKSDDSK